MPAQQTVPSALQGHPACGREVPRNAGAVAVLGGAARQEETTQVAEKKIQSVAVIGLGYVGLPLAAAFGCAGLQALGFDTDVSKVERLRRCKSYVERVSGDVLRELTHEALFWATTDPDRLSDVDAVVICVPTPLKEGNVPDLSAVEATAHTVGASLRPGQLVVLESTTYPGTTEEVVRPILEEESGLSAESDFFLAYSPEREDPGNKEFGISNVPKVVGGLTPEACDAAAALYTNVAPSVVRVSSTRVAEATKMLENTYRAVNIALVNELKVVFEAMGVDIWEAIEAAKTKPFGFQAFTPGPGMGGHCIPVDPFYLSWRAKCLGEEARFIELAGRVNVEMPRRVVEKLDRALDARGKPLAGSTVMLLGAAYKPDVADDRESPFYEVAQQLLARGARVQYNDPHIPRVRPTRRFNLSMDSTPFTADTLGAADAVVILTDHSTYDPDLIRRESKLVVDTRNLTNGAPEGREKIVRA